ncbi:LuxR C-terminal-related transcriptional regulator [Olivibacter sp. XZL3]|uniref:LuxR C-terminal-related transcriptional regulator n=1 Tax=Olivibacter sp. XZL3 TaxID=1735116 RepID=UPI0010659898|nr:LuxR C-terminal-related transcriptional regulator [Olivibacter sp. XZL3]
MSANIKLRIQNPLLKTGLQAMLKEEKNILLLRDESYDELADICLFELNNEDDIRYIKNMESISLRSRILTVLSANDLSLVTQALEYQVAGVLMDNASAEELLFAIEYIIKGNKYVAPSISLQFIQKIGSLGSSTLFSSKMELLNQKERDVLELIMSGHANREIAYQLFTTKRKIEEIRKSIMKKIGVENNLSLTAFYLNQELYHKDQWAQHKAQA